MILNKIKIQKINIIQNEDVYDLKVHNNHNFFANGLLIHNCSEIPLCAYDSCRLLVLNLYSYVENPFTSDATFNYEKFNKHTQMAQRIMDDIVDLELEKIDTIIKKIESDPEDIDIKRTELNLWEKIYVKCIEGRRTGVGITAEGDMLAALGIKYGTIDATNFCENIHKKLALSAYRSSVDMAKDRGSFPIFDASREENNPMINRLKNEDEQLYLDMVKYGRRNISLLTAAPCGSVSLMTQTSSGIEPVFMVSYKRRRKVNPNDKQTRVDFVDDVGDSWEEYHVFHHKFITWLTINGYNAEEVSKMEEPELNQIILKSPYSGATANDVDWVEKVRLQGAVQKWIDHAISVTVNIPNNSTEDLVSQIYQTGWESGCKGITVYRDGSRSGVLIANDKKEENKENNKIQKNNAIKRPKSLSCDIHQVTADGVKWIVFVGLLENEPYEIFAFKPKSIQLSNKIKSGILTKIKKGRYDLDCGDITIENIGENFETNEQEALTRMISTTLRHGVDIEFVVDQLTKSEGTIVSFSKAIARTLKKYITEVKSGKTCPKCDSENIAIQEGCLICLECGDSKCS